MRTRFDVSAAFRHFMLVEGKLYRRLVGGTLSAVTRMDHGRLICVVDGRTYAAADVIWALTYQMWPKWSLAVLGPCCMENLYPQRLAKRRIRVTEAEGRFYHPLAEIPHASYDTCVIAWQELVRCELLADLPFVLRTEAAEFAMYYADRPAFEPPVVSKVVLKSEVKAKAVRVERAERPLLLRSEIPTKPAAIAGRRWHWYKKAWVSVPEPVHVCDDYVLRIAAQKAGQKLVFCPLTAQMVKEPQSQPA